MSLLQKAIRSLRKFLLIYNCREVSQKMFAGRDKKLNGYVYPQWTDVAETIANQRVGIINRLGPRSVRSEYNTRFYYRAKWFFYATFRRIIGAAFKIITFNVLAHA